MDKSLLGADSGLRNTSWMHVYTEGKFVTHFGSIIVY